MTVDNNHICVCICTYKRPLLLEKLINKLQNQQTDGLFTYSVVIVDNDSARSAKSTVDDARENARVPVDYHVEPAKNIALARNKAVQNAQGNYLAFIDDDEFPADDWLLNLFRARKRYNAHAVLGPVIPYFDVEPPKWLIRGKLCERDRYETGTVLPWSKTRTGNVLLDKRAIEANHAAFDPHFGSGGEDVVFFKQLSQKGCFFIWCNEAPVYENVPTERCTKRYFLRRAFFQGNVSYNYAGSMRWKNKMSIFMKSSVAIFAYTLVLPLAYMGGMHRFMKYLIKDVHHISRLLALSRIVVVKQRSF